MTAPNIDERILAYFAIRERQRAAALDRALSAMSAREQKLVREAAVMGYVHGCMAGRSGAATNMPPDSVVLAVVVGACLAMPDLYPIISGAEEADHA